MKNEKRKNGIYTDRPVTRLRPKYIEQETQNAHTTDKHDTHYYIFYQEMLGLPPWNVFLM